MVGQFHKLTITFEGGHGKSAKSKGFVAPGGMLPRSQAGHSIVDSSPGVNASIVYGMYVPIGPHLSTAYRALNPTYMEGEVLGKILTISSQCCEFELTK